MKGDFYVDPRYKNGTNIDFVFTQKINIGLIQKHCQESLEIINMFHRIEKRKRGIEKGKKLSKRMNIGFMSQKINIRFIQKYC